MFIETKSAMDDLAPSERHVLATLALTYRPDGVLGEWEGSIDITPLWDYQIP